MAMPQSKPDLRFGGRFNESYLRSLSTEKLMSQYRTCSKKICTLDFYRRCIDRELHRRVITSQKSLFDHA